MVKLTYTEWVETDQDLEINNETKGALNALRWAYGEYDDELVYACSFGVEGIVMIDLISQIKPTAKVVFLDTGLHFQETYALIDEVRKSYPQLAIELKKPADSVEQQAEKLGDKLWERQPDRCCYLRKVIPLREALSGAAAWLSGLRREQSPSRSQTNFINKDETFQSVKICPLIHWTWEDIWAYVDQHQLPYNPLHDQGYPSIGCAPCTLPGDTTTGSRLGRWADQTKTECGLHKN
ncbi:phosphoadenylyl-sulfate reductase [Sporosarcina sp. FSL K6-2383]|uniref:phosphoadenylyl-sulfate reductase n=1 Tax=Sporosarcina sp. FSL K6-2383 TaxID=2921556 RepID=UPI00315A1DCD